MNNLLYGKKIICYLSPYKKRSLQTADFLSNSYCPGILIYLLWNFALLFNL